MKIDFIVPTMGFGGAERVISILSNAFVKKGIDVSISIFSVSSKDCVYPLDDKINKYFIQSCRFSSIRKIKETLNNIDLHLSLVKPDVVICFTNVVASQVSIVCKKKNIPIIFSERNDPSKLLRGVKNQMFQFLLKRNVRNFVFQTKGAESFYSNIKKIHSTIILNPIEFSKMPCPFEGERKKEIVSVGRLEKQKRQDLLIKAFNIFIVKHPDYHLTIYGEGNERQNLESLIKKFNLENLVSLPGVDKNIHKKILDSGMFVFTSDFEGLPNALIEAMCLGLPAISTKCSPGGAEEVIINNENGLLVDCDDIIQISNAMTFLADNPNFSNRIGFNAVKIREKVNPEYIVTQWEVFINDTINRQN